MGLIPLPNPDSSSGAPRLWINSVNIVTAAAIIDRSREPHQLLVELKLQGLNLTRYWLAAGTDEELQSAWDAFAAQLE